MTKTGGARRIAYRWKTPGFGGAYPAVACWAVTPDLCTSKARWAAYQPTN